MEQEGAMEALGKFFDGVASLAWPAIFFFLLYHFKDQIKDIVASLKNRTFEINVGGAKLSFGQAADQLGKEIADLRNEFIKFKADTEHHIRSLSGQPKPQATFGLVQTIGKEVLFKRAPAIGPKQPTVFIADASTAKAAGDAANIDAMGYAEVELEQPGTQAADAEDTTSINIEDYADLGLEPPDAHTESIETAQTTKRAKKICRVLWIDDNPSNNAFITKELQDAGVAITAVTSTFDGLKNFNNHTYDLVISDMGRAEGNVINFKAGVDLTQQIRQTNQTVPIAIYCSKQAKVANGAAALNAGANIVVSSPTKLMAFIHQINS
jgi:CheY-like chemotaxis protein